MERNRLMTGKPGNIFILTLLFVAFLVVSSSGMHPSGKAKSSNAIRVDQLPKDKLAGAERSVNYIPPVSGGGRTLGFDELRSNSPGLTVGYTTYDYQSNGRMNRQVDWRGTEMVHFDWTKQLDSTLGGDRGTGYEAWDYLEAEFILAQTQGGGCDIHARLGPGYSYSGYVGLDVDTEGKANISNHHEEGAGYASTVWYDFNSGACFFTAFMSRLPDSTMEYIQDPNGEQEYIWPSHEYHIFDGDTVTHVFAQQSREEIAPQIIAYFRRLGSDTTGYWAYPPVVVDTVMDIAQTVTASRVSGKTALVWLAGLPSIPGDGESVDRGTQVVNDVYYAMSYDMGASWGAVPGTVDKFNITKSDSSKAGWRAHTDLSCLIGTDDLLHIIWDAREFSPVPAPTGSFLHPFGSRLFHWDESTDAIRVIKDANWDLSDENPCNGGAWNTMSIVKMQLSECNGKFYALFVQFNDIHNGIDDDCHSDAFTAGAIFGYANGELYLSVSDNGGFNWDVARNLTNTYTPGCDHEVENDCDADQWPSMSRFGMQVIDGDFTGVPVVDPSGDYAGSYYLDVLYINDKHPSACVQDGAVWTYNPVKWFRVPCVEPVPNPVLAMSPSEIGDPTWTKPGIQLDTTIRLENVGNAELHITGINVVEISGSDWLGIGSFPDVISHLIPNYYDLDVYLNMGGGVTEDPVGLDGYLEIASDNAGGTVVFDVHLIVADSVQFPGNADIRTECTRLIFNNAGNLGNSGNIPYGRYNLNLFDDCDTTNNRSGADDHAGVYLYDGSPFILRVNEAGDTVLNHYMFDADWLADDGFRPLEGSAVDSVTYPDYQYGYTGKFLTKDSAIALEVEYFAPTHPDTCNFIVMKQRIYNNTASTIEGVYVGDFYDWDVPSDSGVENGSGYDAVGGPYSRDLMYCYGGEWGIDNIENNDCVLADERYAGMAFYNGFKLPYHGADDSLENPAGPWWTHTNDDWITSGSFVAEQIYRKIIEQGSGFESWEAQDPNDPDSQYVDLHMVAVSGQFDIGVNDTLVFVKILATENGQSKSLIGLLQTVDRARAWIAARPEIFTWPEATGCCDRPGDANNSGGVNILDVTKIINYLYKGADPPPCLDEADANGGNGINILDVTRIINYLYKGGDPPVCGTTGT